MKGLPRHRPACASAEGRRLLTIDRPNQGHLGTPRGPPDRPEPLGETRISLWDRDHPDAPEGHADPARPEALDPPFNFGRPGLPLLAISPDGSRIAAARPVRDRDLALGRRRASRSPRSTSRATPRPWRWGPAGLLAVAGTGGEIALWDLSPGGPKRLPGLGLAPELRLAPPVQSPGRLDPRRRRDGGGIELWDLSTHSMIAALPTKEGVEDLAFSPDGRTLAAGQPFEHRDSGRSPSRSAQHVLPETGEIPRGVAFGPGDLLAIASSEANQPPGAAPALGRPRPAAPPRSGWEQVRPVVRRLRRPGAADRRSKPTRSAGSSRPAPDPVAKVELPALTVGRRPSRLPARTQREGPPDRPSPRPIARGKVSPGRDSSVSRPGRPTAGPWSSPGANGSLSLARSTPAMIVARLDPARADRRASAVEDRPPPSTPAAPALLPEPVTARR